MFPGVSKRDVLDYYLAVAPRLLDQIGHRPTALERWSDGVLPGNEHFFNKHLPARAPDYVNGARVEFPSGRPGVLFCPSSPAEIAWAVQMSTVTFHAWPVTAPDTDHPDQLRIDIDPSPANSFDEVVVVARACRALMTDWGLPSHVKTSGGRGVHVFVPILPVHSFVDVRHAAIAVGREIERALPELVTMSWWKEERGDRIFIDYNQNAQDRLMASAYSLRPRPEATVSLPIAWADLPSVQPEDFTIRTVPGLVASTSDPWVGAAAAAVSLAPALAAWQRDVDAGLAELPYPPDFPKMPGEPPRVQPSRRRQG